MVAGRYELERPLGHGAMAVVDLVRDVELGTLRRAEAPRREPRA